MSSLTLFQSGNQLPAHLRRGELSETAKALMGGGNSKRISIEGGAFRMVVGGKEVAVSEDRAMNIIVLRAAEHNSRTYYEDSYQKGVKAKPTCWSSDSQTPDPAVKTPQSNACATCPQNIKGPNGSRPCRFQRRLAVLLENDPHGDIYAMSIPAASVFAQGEGRKMGLQQYGKFLGSHGVDVTAVVTEMKFDTASTAPKLVFSAVRPLEEVEWETVQSRRDDPAALDAVTMTVPQLDGDDTTPAQAPAPAPVAAPAPKAAGGFKPKAAAPAPAKEVEEPTARETPKAAANASVPNVNSILSAWGDDSDD